MFGYSLDFQWTDLQFGNYTNLLKLSLQVDCREVFGIFGKWFAYKSRPNKMAKDETVETD